jgi:hypothetical protein
MLLWSAILFSASLYLNARYKISNSFCCKFLNNLQKAIIDYRTEFKKSVYFLVEVATTLNNQDNLDVFIFARLATADRESDRP